MTTHASTRRSVGDGCAYSAELLKPRYVERQQLCVQDEDRVEAGEVAVHETEQRVWRDACETAIRPAAIPGRARMLQL